MLILPAPPMSKLQPYNYCARMAATSPAPTGASDQASKRTHVDLTAKNVYTMTTQLGQEIQKLASKYGTVDLETIVELVAQALEQLEYYVVETERLNTENCRILLDLDQLVLAKESEEILQTELQAMKLVSEERGRQRDALALRVGELEATKEKLVQQVYELKKSRTNLSSPTSVISPRSHSVKHGHHQCLEEAHHLELTHNHMVIKKLKSDIEKERKQFGEIIESRTLEHRRMERRLEVTNMELEKFKTSLAVSEKQIQKLQLEKKAMFERTEILKEISKKLMYYKPEFSSEEDELHKSKEPIETAPRFFKQDLLLLLEERNRLKQDLTSAKEELDTLKANCACSLNRKEASSRECRLRSSTVRDILEESFCSTGAECNYRRQRTMHVDECPM